MTPRKYSMWAAIYDTLHRHPLVTGWLGSATTLSAAGVGALQELDLFLRVCASGLGVVAGILTVLITWRKWWHVDKD